MVALIESILDRYEENHDIKSSSEEKDSGFIFFVAISNSPQVKQGLLPSIMTLIDYNIECLGSLNNIHHKLSHISYLDLSNNLISEWSEFFKILATFKGLSFLNLANNLLSNPIKAEHKFEDSHRSLKKVIV